MAACEVCSGSGNSFDVIARVGAVARRARQADQLHGMQTEYSI